MARLERKFSAFSIDAAVPLRGRHYYHFLRNAIASAKYRIWASIFIINVEREHDPQQEVRDLLKLLAYKRYLGVDVRVVIGDSQNVPDIKVANEIAIRFLRANGINAKRYRGPKKSTHSKYAIIDDDLIIVGSQNWTDNAFSKSEEDAIAVYSENLSNELQYRFLSTWKD